MRTIKQKQVLYGSVDMLKRDNDVESNSFNPRKPVKTASENLLELLNDELNDHSIPRLYSLITSKQVAGVERSRSDRSLSAQHDSPASKRAVNIVRISNELVIFVLINLHWNKYEVAMIQASLWRTRHKWKMT